MERYISAKDAARLLGVKPATLYAYVSRGLIRSEMVDDSNRERRYLAEDVRKLAERKEQRRDPAKVAKDALNWGTPVLESAITLIDDHRLYYRGQDACALAVEQSFEYVATLLWTGNGEDGERLFAESTRHKFHLPPQLRGLPAMPALQIILAAVGAQDFAAYNLSPEAVAQAGTRILYLMTDVLADGVGADEKTIADTLARAWGANAEIINAALILCADHELNASSFAARVTASADSNPYQVVMAGLAALQGVKHGGNTEQVAALFREVAEPAHAYEIIGERLRRGERIPGFGHRLYPQGDPRATALFSLLEKHAAESPVLALAEAIAREGQRLIDRAPNIDIALVTMELACKMPRGAALSIFALGRAAGWIGHAIEQYTTQTIIRPRARYIGKLPNK
jgi:citrate synthase